MKLIKQAENFCAVLLGMQGLLLFATANGVEDQIPLVLQLLIVLAGFGLILILQNGIRVTGISYKRAVAAAIVAGILALFICRNVFLWFAEYLYGREDFKLHYSTILLFLASILMTLIVPMLRTQKITRVLLFTIVLGMVLYSIVFQYSIDILFVFLVTQYLVTDLAFYLGIEKRTSFLAPIIYLVALIVMVIPFSETPIQWTGLKNIVESCRDNIENILYQVSRWGDQGNMDFSIPIAGYSSEDEKNYFGRFLQGMDYTLMYVNPGSSGYGDGYLKASERDYYTENGWETRAKESSAELLEKYGLTISNQCLNSYEILYHLYESNLPVSEQTYAAQPRSYHITYDKLDTSSTFYPVNCISLSTENPQTASSGKQPNYVAIGLDLNQEAAVLLMGMETKGLADQIQGELSAYEEVISMIKDRESIEEVILSAEYADYLKKARQMIEDQYLQLPDTMSQRVRLLAEDITDQCSNEYEKILAVKYYLKQYSYEQQIEELPKGKEATDYFLFESKVGYCTYFATATTLMLRSIGIPARYVEGVVINSAKRVNEGYEIHNTQTHAWCEAYMDGYGWMIVDATPGYGETLTGKSFQKFGYEGVTATEEEIYNEEAATIEEERAQEEKEHIRQDETRDIVVIWLTLGVLSLVCIAMITGLILKTHASNMLKKADEREKVLRYMKYYLAYWECMGIKLAPGESLQEFYHRLTKQEPASKMDEDMIRIYEKARYSSDLVTKEMVMNMEKILDSLRQQCVVRCGRGKVFFIDLLAK